MVSKFLGITPLIEISPLVTVTLISKAFSTAFLSAVVNWLRFLCISWWNTSSLISALSVVIHLLVLTCAVKLLYAEKESNKLHKLRLHSLGSRKGVLRLYSRYSDPYLSCNSLSSMSLL